MTETKDARPRFRTVGKPPHVTLWLQCSACAKDIRPLLNTETIDVRRGHYCNNCNDGTVHLNLPEKK